MTFSTRLLLAVSLSLAPLGWAAAQDQQDQRQREKQEQHPQQQPKSNQPQQHTAPQQGNTSPQGKGAGGPPAGAQQFQRPPQTNAAPPNVQNFQRPPQTNVAPPNAQSFQRPPQTNAGPPSSPPGTTASPTPPGQNQFRRVPGPPPQNGTPPTGSVQQQQFQRVQGPLQNGSPPPTGSVQQQQQFQQRSVQRGGGPSGSAGSGPQQQQTTTFRGNVQGGARSRNPAVFAQRHGGAAPTQFNRGLFYGRDFAHFTPRETALWRGGAWRREFHDGRLGWWFVVDDIWYFYDQPIYPYPTFIPDVVYIPDAEYGYDDDDAYADAGDASLPNGVFYANGTYYYYYCPALQAYYPYVGTCPSPWQTVPATPQ